MRIFHRSGKNFRTPPKFAKIFSYPPKNPLTSLLRKKWKTPYQRYVLGKVSWHLTVTRISATWIKENLDNVVSNYVRSWMEIPVNGTEW